jgi:hypothetical protein
MTEAATHDAALSTHIAQLQSQPDAMVRNSTRRVTSGSEN